MTEQKQQQVYLCEAPSNRVGSDGHKLPCGEPATHEYIDGIHRGYLCQTHATWRSQQAHAYGKFIQLVRLAPEATLPLSRDKSIEFRARIMALEDELKHAKSGAAQLYSGSQQVTRQLQALHTKHRELERLYDDSEKRNATLQAEVERLLAELGERTEEVQRLEVIATPDDRETALAEDLGELGERYAKLQVEHSAALQELAERTEQVKRLELIATPGHHQVDRDRDDGPPETS